jgi:putative tryptophan/tyrosine transport system substrate-binding protein
VIDRRAFVAGTLALLAAPLDTEAQPPAKIHRIGLLGGSSPTSPEASHLWGAFFQGLRDLGYVEGQNVLIEGRWYGDRSERLPALAAELVRLPVDVIVAGTAPSPEAAKRATSTIPIVMANHSDPVASGLVASLARPGGNVTGLSSVGPELSGKQLQLLKETLPSLSRVAVLTNPTIPSQALSVREMEVAARSLKLQLQVVEARAPSEFADAFSAATRERAGGLVVLGGSVFFAHRPRLVELAAQNRLPTMYGPREFAQVGGLMAYGVDIRDSWRRAAGYVDRILKGAKPADLPVEQPTKFELVINLKAAKALGLTIPPSVLARADQVIE